MPDLTTASASAVQTKSAPLNWPMVGLLLLLTGIPGIPAIFIVVLVVVGPSAGTELSSLVNALHFETPAAVLIHGGSGIVFFLSMPFQFSPALRYKHLKSHRIGGRIALTAGYLLALSGIWMHHVLLPGLMGARYVSLIMVSIAMCAAFSLALKHILHRNRCAHRIWMCRAVAISLSVVTPLFLELILYLLSGHLGETFTACQQILHDYGRLVGMAINLGVVEYIFYRERHSAHIGGLTEPHLSSQHSN